MTSPFRVRLRGTEAERLAAATPPGLVAAGGPIEATIPPSLRLTHTELQAASPAPDAPLVVSVLVFSSVQGSLSVTGKSPPRLVRLLPYQPRAERVAPGDRVSVDAAGTGTVKVWPLVRLPS